MNTEWEHKINAEVVKVVSVIIGIVVVLLGILVWFISIVITGVEFEQLRHETCMVITETRTSTTGEPTVTVTVTEYCGPLHVKEQQK